MDLVFIPVSEKRQVSVAGEEVKDIVVLLFQPEEKKKSNILMFLDPGTFSDRVNQPRDECCRRSILSY